MAGPLALIFCLGAVQGAVGWWMVASGLADRTEVSQYRLATHLLLASLIFAALIWSALSFGKAAPAVQPRVTRRATLVARVIVVLVLIQIYLGGLVAGLRAGLVYNTWPLIDGAFVPSAARLLFETPLWRNIFENALTAQFDHRMVAYTLWIVTVLHAIDVARGRKNDRALQSAVILAGAVTVQAFIGIFTLLTQAPIDLALIHQAMAMIVLAIAVVHARSLSRQRMPVPDRQ
jgi:cytochrome c oxidase assembly protein subunit 15